MTWWDWHDTTGSWLVTFLLLHNFFLLLLARILRLIFRLALSLTLLMFPLAFLAVSPKNYTQTWSCSSICKQMVAPAKMIYRQTRQIGSFELYCSGITSVTDSGCSCVHSSRVLQYQIWHCVHLKIFSVSSWLHSLHYITRIDIKKRTTLASSSLLEASCFLLRVVGIVN